MDDQWGESQQMRIVEQVVRAGQYICDYKFKAGASVIIIKII